MRRLLVLIHLLVAAFIAPAFLLLGISGGLYLFGIKGSEVSTPVPVAKSISINFAAEDLSAEVRSLFSKAGIDHEFEYIRSRGTELQTRPTSRDYFNIKQADTGLVIEKREPDLQKSMIELHKGHGPTIFKTYQKLVAFALIGAVLSGFWMGIITPSLRRKTVVASVLGLLAFLALALA